MNLLNSTSRRHGRSRARSLQGHQTAARGLLHHADVVDQLVQMSTMAWGSARVRGAGAAVASRRSGAKALVHLLDLVLDVLNLLAGRLQVAAEDLIHQLHAIGDDLVKLFDVDDLLGELVVVHLQTAAKLL